MADNTLKDFTDYICLLASKHVEIKHTETDKHFIELSDEQQLSGKNLRLPVVALDKLELTYKGLNDALRKDRYVEILFLDRCSDSANAPRIQEIKNKMEAICEDFLNKMREDKRLRKFEFLKTLIIPEVKVFQIENMSKDLYGAMMAFNFDLPYSGNLKPGRFID